MFRSVTLTDFQSHKNSHIELGPFTVIIGSSSSGKSAVVRALRLVAENARGTSYVRQGASAAQVAVEIEGSEPVLDASTVVTVRRGKSLSQYEIRPPGMHEEPVVYTKCGHTVPAGVSEVLGLGESSLWLAGQFDRPFLLDETGAEVARVLGRLTNVTMIYAAVREANRRGAEAGRFATAKQKELDDVTETFGQFQTLPARMKAGQDAEQGVERCEGLVERRNRLSSLTVEFFDADMRASLARENVRSVPDVSRLTRLHELRQRVEGVLEDLESAEAVVGQAQRVRDNVPDTQNFAALSLRRASLLEALGSLSEAEAHHDELREKVAASREAADQARTQFSEAFAESGSCPLCGASAEHAHLSSVL